MLVPQGSSFHAKCFPEHMLLPLRSGRTWARMGAPQSTNSTDSTQSCRQHGAGIHQVLFIYSRKFYWPCQLITVMYSRMFAAWLLIPFVCLKYFIRVSCQSGVFLLKVGGGGEVLTTVSFLCVLGGVSNILCAISKLGQGAALNLKRWRVPTCRHFGKNLHQSC